MPKTVLITGCSSGIGRAATAESVAEVLLQAVNDASDRLRYPAGPEARAIYELRDQMSGEEFVAAMRSHFPA